MTVRKFITLNANGINLNGEFALIEIDDEEITDDCRYSSPSSKGDFIIAHGNYLELNDVVIAKSNNTRCYYEIDGMIINEFEFVIDYNAEEIAKNLGIEHEIWRN